MELSRGCAQGQMSQRAWISWERRTSEVIVSGHVKVKAPPKRTLAGHSPLLAKGPDRGWVRPVRCYLRSASG
jgi:hypothetical protein